jgi:hypothetical protein
VHGTVAVFDPVVRVTTNVHFVGNTLIRTDMRSWVEAGFSIGQLVTVNGVVVGAVAGFTGPTQDILVLTAVAVPPCASGSTCVVTVAQGAASDNAVRYGGNVFTVTGGAGGGRDPAERHRHVHDRAVRILADAHPRQRILDRRRLRVRHGAAGRRAGLDHHRRHRLGPDAQRPRVHEHDRQRRRGGYAPSPLVVYGATSQDGIWYSGDPIRRPAGCSDPSRSRTRSASGRRSSSSRSRTRSATRATT